MACSLISPVRLHPQSMISFPLSSLAAPQMNVIKGTIFPPLWALLVGLLYFPQQNKPQCAQTHMTICSVRQGCAQVFTQCIGVFALTCTHKRNVSGGDRQTRKPVCGVAISGAKQKPFNVSVSPCPEGLKTLFVRVYVCLSMTVCLVKNC